LDRDFKCLGENHHVVARLFFHGSISAVSPRPNRGPPDIPNSEISSQKGQELS
jgi:hypothetical protein